MKKELKEYVRELLREGWSYEQGRKHIKLRTPEGQLFTYSATPSCPYAIQKLKSDIKRYRKKEK